MAEQTGVEVIDTPEARQDCGCGCGGAVSETATQDCGCGCGGSACGNVAQEVVLVGPLAAQDAKASAAQVCDCGCGCCD